MNTAPHMRLSQLTGIIQQTLDDAFRGRNFWVVADVTNHSYKPQTQYHYFELVEKGAGDILAKIACKAWGRGSTHIAQFEKATGQRFTNNIQVLVNVAVSYHPKWGLQLELQDIDTSYTLGVLEQQRQETLARLVAENRGYIWKEGEAYRTKNQELPLPLVIRNIALVSALNSAGAEDFRHTLEYNDHGYRFRIDEYHTAVQGENNAEAFLDCLISVYRAQTPYDVVVITRGGGAQSDFLIFDNYRIGQAVAKYPIPVITGIGHQKNETVADLMAHTALKTPTKAAEFIIAHNRAFEDRITALQQTIIIRSQQMLSGQMQALAARKSSLVNHTRDILSREKDGMAYLNQSVTSHTRNILYGAKSALLRSASVLVSRPGAIISRKQHDLSTITGNIRTFKAQYLKNQQGYLNHFKSMIRMMSPENILRKGFALVKVDGRITSDPGTLTPGRDMDIILSDTQVSATVKQKTPYDGNDFNI